MSNAAGMRVTKKDLENFSKAVRSRRSSIGLSQNTMAIRVGISNQQMSNIEHANCWPSMPVYIKLCNALEAGIPPMVGI